MEQNNHEIISIQSLRGKHFAHGMMPEISAAEIQFTKDIYTHTPNGEKEYDIHSEKFYLLAVVHDEGRKFILSKKSYYSSFLFEYDPKEENAEDYDENSQTIVQFETEPGQEPDFSQLEYSDYYELANSLATRIWNDQ